MPSLLTRPSLPFSLTPGEKQINMMSKKDHNDDYPPISDHTEYLIDPRASRISAAAGMSSMANPATGLTEEEGAVRLAHFGKNCLAEKEVNLFRKFCGYFWGPMPIMIWAGELLCLMNYLFPSVRTIFFSPLTTLSNCVLPLDNPF